MVLHLKVWESRSPPGLQNTAQKIIVPLYLPLPGPVFLKCPSGAGEAAASRVLRQIMEGGIEQPARRDESRGKTNNRYRAKVRGSIIDAGWSSPVARQAHNLKVAGSNPAPATIQKPLNSMS